MEREHTRVYYISQYWGSSRIQRQGGMATCVLACIVCITSHADASWSPCTLRYIPPRRLHLQSLKTTVFPTSCVILHTQGSSAFFFSHTSLCRGLCQQALNRQFETYLVSSASFQTTQPSSCSILCSLVTYIPHTIPLPLCIHTWTLRFGWIDWVDCSYIVFRNRDICASGNQHIWIMGSYWSAIESYCLRSCLPTTSALLT